MLGPAHQYRIRAALNSVTGLHLSALSLALTGIVRLASSALVGAGRALGMKSHAAER